MTTDDIEEIGASEMPARPTPLPVRPDSIPALLQSCSRWVGWNYDLDQRGWTKVPYVATDPRQKASVSNRQTWRSFAQAVTAYQTGQFAGIGFVLGPTGDAADRVVGVDLDHCVESGRIAEWADRIIARLNSYTELSPSGTGVRIFALADGLPGDGRKKGPIELYLSGRYLTVTGHHI